MTIPTTGFTTKDETAELADQIKEFWAKRGYQITTKLIQVNTGIDGQYRFGWAIRSDLCNGLPRNFKGKIV